MPEIAKNLPATTPMRIKTTEIALESIGYPEWTVTMRTNPRMSVYDGLVSGDTERWWKAFGEVVLGWTLTDERGETLPLPSATESETELDLPIGVLRYVLDRYFAAVAAVVAPPSTNAPVEGAE